MWNEIPVMWYKIGEKRNHKGKHMWLTGSWNQGLKLQGAQGQVPATQISWGYFAVRKILPAVI